jgi:hypothetical protein
MPIKSKAIDLLNRGNERMRALVAWNQIVPNLGLADMQYLLDFRRRYGSQAMISKAKSLLQKRELVKPAYLAKIKAKTELMQSMLAMRSSSRVGAGHAGAVSSLKARKRKSVIEGLAKRLEPLMRSVLTLAFTVRVVEKWLSREEIERMTGVNDSVKNREIMKNLIEKRSGITVKQQMDDIAWEVENDFVAMWVANIKDGQLLTQNSAYAQDYENLLSEGDLAQLTTFFMKGKQ